MEANFKPCPFCGAEVQSPEDEDSMYCVEHKEWCVLYDRWRGYTTVLAEHEVEAWNTRYERTCRYKRVEGALHISECGMRKYFVDVPLPLYCPECGGKVTH